MEEVKTLRIPIDFFPCKTVNISGRYIMFTLCSHLVGVASYGSQSYDSARRQSELIAVDCLEQLPSSAARLLYGIPMRCAGFGLEGRSGREFFRDGLGTMERCILLCALWQWHCDCQIR